MEKTKDKIAYMVTVLSMAAVLAGYGIWVGRINTKVDVLERNYNKIETVIDKQIGSLNSSLHTLTTQTAVLQEKVDQLRLEVKNGQKQ